MYETMITQDRGTFKSGELSTRHKRDQSTSTKESTERCSAVPVPVQSGGDIKGPRRWRRASLSRQWGLAGSLTGWGVGGLLLGALHDGIVPYNQIKLCEIARRQEADATVFCHFQAGQAGGMQQSVW